MKDEKSKLSTAIAIILLLATLLISYMWLF